MAIPYSIGKLDSICLLLNQKIRNLKAFLHCAKVEGIAGFSGWIVLAAKVVNKRVLITLSRESRVRLCVAFQVT